MPAPNLYAQRLQLLQSFKETTWGTTGTATAKWMGVEEYPEFKPYRKATLFNEARGSVVPAFIASQLRTGGEWKVPLLATYEDILYSLLAVSGSNSGSSPYTFTGASTAQPTLQTYTFEYNQSGFGLKAQGCVANKLTVKGNASEAWKLELSGFAQDIDPTWSGSPASLGDRTVEAILMPSTGLCMDVVSGSVGATSFPNVLVDFTWTFENLAKPIYTAGSLAPQGWVISGAMKSTLELSLLWTAQVRNFLNANLNSASAALVQVKAASGAKYCTLNFAGALSDEIAYFGNKDGAEMVKFKLDAVYNANAALWTNVLVANGVAALT